MATSVDVVVAAEVSDVEAGVLVESLLLLVVAQDVFGVGVAPVEFDDEAEVGVAGGPTWHEVAEVAVLVAVVTAAVIDS